jgi:hypothetical protein
MDIVTLLEWFAFIDGLAVVQTGMAIGLFMGIRYLKRIK